MIKKGFSIVMEKAPYGWNVICGDGTRIQCKDYKEAVEVAEEMRKKDYEGADIESED